MTEERFEELSEEMKNNNKYNHYIENSIERKAMIEYVERNLETDTIGRFSLFVGLCYFSGDCVKKDYIKALEWFKKSVDQGNALAMYKIGACYCLPSLKNDSKEILWYTKSAELGHADAQYSLGACYYNGEGIDKNLEQAVYWYIKHKKRELLEKIN